MSAENELTMFRMSNGEYWVVIRRCGDTMIRSYGECFVQKKCPSYQAALSFIMKSTACDEMSDDYIYTEYGARIPTEQQLLDAPARFVRSSVSMYFTGRECHCLDHRDLQVDKWTVEESPFGPGEDRIIGENLSYAKALTIANTYAMRQPGECYLTLPFAFRDFIDYEGHNCLSYDNNDDNRWLHWKYPNASVYQD